METLLLFLAHGKTHIVIMINTKRNDGQYNDFRLVAPTYVISKSQERHVCDQLISSVDDRKDRLQFANTVKRGVDPLTRLDLIA